MGHLSIPMAVAAALSVALPLAAGAQTYTATAEELEAARCRGRLDTLEAIVWPRAPFEDRDKAEWDLFVRESSLKVDGRNLERFLSRSCAVDRHGKMSEAMMAARAVGVQDVQACAPLAALERWNCERALRCGWQFDAPERRNCAADAAGGK